jgi:hypothetical protein
VGRTWQTGGLLVLALRESLCALEAAPGPNDDKIKGAPVPPVARAQPPAARTRMPNANTSAAVLIFPQRSSSGAMWVIVPKVRVSRCVAPSARTREMPKSDTFETRPKGDAGEVDSSTFAAWGVQEAPRGGQS